MGDAPKTDTLAEAVRAAIEWWDDDTEGGEDAMERLRAALAAHDTPPPPFEPAVGWTRADRVCAGCGTPDTQCERLNGRCEPCCDNCWPDPSEVHGKSGVLRDPEPPAVPDRTPTGDGVVDLLGALEASFANVKADRLERKLAEGGQLDADDELLVRAGRVVEILDVDSVVGDSLARVVRDLASALRRTIEAREGFRQSLAGVLSENIRLERELAEARSGLQHINRHGCEHFTRGSCLTDPSRSRDAEYGADQWCDPCIAADALGKKENSRGGGRSHGEVLARVETVPIGISSGAERSLALREVPYPPGTEVLVVLAPTEDER